MSDWMSVDPVRQSAREKCKAGAAAGKSLQEVIDQDLTPQEAYVVGFERGFSEVLVLEDHIDELQAAFAVPATDAGDRPVCSDPMCDCDPCRAGRKS